MQELSLWLREVGLMLRNGTDLAAALAVLEQQDFSRPLRAMTTEMIEEASAEAGLEDLISARADVFPAVVAFALRSGRAGERVPETLLALADALDRAADLGMTLAPPGEAANAAPSPEGAPVVRMVNSILRQAAKAKASEVRIHASEAREYTLVECSVNGERVELAELPLDLLGPICRRICVMAGINWALRQPALGTLRLGQREGDLQGAVRFLPGDEESGHRVGVTLTHPSPF
jgi:type II secretory ATPase GspE/PulE/Tfp pilus assembly ATPase PilB-like protein